LKAPWFGDPTLEAIKCYVRVSTFAFTNGVNVCRYAEESRRTYGEVIPSHNPADARLFALRQPVGVTAAITPWNFPLAMITRKAGAALAAGCVMVIKPSELTPLSALALGVLAQRAGIPPGVLQFITGDAPAIGEALTSSAAVRKLSFTGSTAVGKALMRQCAETVKRTSMELGGNAPFIVFADADVDAAVEGAVASKFRNSGQTCVCAQRFLVHASVAEEFAGKLAERAARMVVGAGLDGPTDQGPLINAAAVAKVEAHVADAVAKGAKVLFGGQRVTPPGTPTDGTGTFYAPTVLTGCHAEMDVFTSETFGPVAAIATFDTEAEAIAAANSTKAGLASYLHTRDVGRLWRVSEALEFGIVGANTGLISTAGAPFGGVKESGIGREGGKHGMEEYLDVKYVCMAGLGS
jgi:succinate-semialdehyde dehydrogenase/glutarate-semialdehyde dehydrogenase